MRLPNVLRVKPVVILLGGVATIALVSMFNHALLPSMEPRFAEVIREMLARDEYLVPIKNDVPYILYPPLYYWLALGAKVLGLPDTAAVRFPAAIAFLFWIAALAGLQRRVQPSWPSWVLPLAGAALPISLAQFNIAQTDSILALGVLLALNGYIDHESARIDGRAGFPWGFWLGTLLAVAAKGPVGLILAGIPVAGEILLAGTLLEPGSRVVGIIHRVVALCPARGLSLVLTVGGSWYVAAGLAHGWDFCRAALVDQNFTRFTVGFNHLEPPWYYIKTISYDFFPYGLLLPYASILAWRQRHRFVWRYIGMAALLPVIFFSLSAAKQSKYLLPAAPAIVLLVLLAVFIRWSDYAARIQKWLGRYSAGMLIVFSSAVLMLPLLDRNDDIGGRRGFADLQAVRAKAPGRLFTYLWPRAPMLYAFGAPLPYFRSAHDLYAAVAAGVILPGDDLLVNERYLRADGTSSPLDLSPVPGPPYFSEIARVEAGQALVLFRVLPGAGMWEVPNTPEPPPVQWWEKYDTD